MTGARTLKVQDNMTPYAIGQSHRHWAEMSEKIAGWSNGHGAPQLHQLDRAGVAAAGAEAAAPVGG